LTFNQLERNALEEEIMAEAARVFEQTAASLPNPRELFDILLRMEEFGARPPGGPRNQPAHYPDQFVSGTAAPFDYLMTEQDIIRRAIERMVNAVVQDLFAPPRYWQQTNYAEGFIHNSQRLFWKEDVLNFAREHLVRKAGDAIIEELTF